ncbi:response regulator [Paenibacillus silvisoli]|uniref:response regulator n=1 Tax=Paenibacillus silvisoli TaxID=3110539 RepID=UPI002803A9BB|nr:response regulator [Paenibacillus silvisoli]
MYRAMIVDDEQWVVKNLLDSVDWARFGFTVVGTETNSPKALQLMKELNPDVAFVDIRMPEISGLELIKKCNEMQLDTLFIVVSGFAEFSYVQKCMNLGALGYCLKPIEEEEIVPLLKKAKDKLDDRSAKDTPSVMEWIMDDKPEGRERVAKLLGNAGLEPAGGLRVVVSLDAEQIGAMLQPYRCLRLSSGNGKSVYIVQESGQAPLFEHLSERAGGFGGSAYRGIGLGGLFHELSALREAIEDAEMAAFQYFIAGRPVVYQSGASKGFADFKQLSSALQKHDMSELTALYDQYIEWFRTGAYQIKHAFFLYNTVMTTIIQSQNSESDGLSKYLLVDYERLLERYQDAAELIQDLKRMSGAYLGGMYREGQLRSDSFAAVIDYVNTNYHQNVSLQMLADEFYMNRNYISQLFIKHVSQSFTDYLAELRVRHACELLKNSNLPIHRVGERVGYHDAYYFSKIFKKIVGKTPREYRTGA